MNWTRAGSQLSFLSDVWDAMLHRQILPKVRCSGIYCEHTSVKYHILVIEYVFLFLLLNWVNISVVFKNYVSNAECKKQALCRLLHLENSLCGIIINWCQAKEWVIQLFSTSSRLNSLNDFFVKPFTLSSPFAVIQHMHYASCNIMNHFRKCWMSSEKFFKPNLKALALTRHQWRFCKCD